MNKKRVYSIILSFGFAIIIMYFLFNFLGEFDLELIKTYFTFEVIIISFFIYLLLKSVNTIRYSLIFGVAGFLKIINILFFSNLILDLVPFRLGEFSYLTLFKKYFKTSYSEGLKNLIFLRSFDYISICLIMIISFILTLSENPKILNELNLILLISLFLLGATFIFIFLFKLNYFLNLKCFKGKFKIINKLTSILFEINFINNKFKILILTLIYWITRFLLGIYLFKVVGLELPLFSLLFLSTLMMLVSLIPLRTFAGFGVFEGTWATGLVLFGVNNKNILNQVLGAHILSIVVIIFFGLIGFIFLNILTQNKFGHTYSKKNS